MYFSTCNLRQNYKAFSFLPDSNYECDKIIKWGLILKSFKTTIIFMSQIKAFNLYFCRIDVCLKVNVFIITLICQI